MCCKHVESYLFVSILTVGPSRAVFDSHNEYNKIIKVIFFLFIFLLYFFITVFVLVMIRGPYELINIY